MVVDDTLSMRIYSFIDNILINKTIKQIKQKRITELDFNTDFDPITEFWRFP